MRMSARGILAILAIVSLQLGAWATVAPRNFYDTFPGAGHHWVAVDGPYNQHLMRDFGGLNLALGIVLAVAAVTLGRTIVRTATAAALASGVPHLLYHATHTSVLATTGDKVGTLVPLALWVVGAAVVLAGSAQARLDDRGYATDGSVNTLTT
jgi:hypothetical protein